MDVLGHGLPARSVAGVSPSEEIQAIVDRETRAWDERDAEAIVSIFHPDMVWPWPPDPQAHDPERWVFPWGRYDRERWRLGWQELFDTHRLRVEAHPAYRSAQILSAPIS